MFFSRLKRVFFVFSRFFFHMSSNRFYYLVNGCVCVCVSTVQCLVSFYKLKWAWEQNQRNHCRARVMTNFIVFSNYIVYQKSNISYLFHISVVHLSFSYIYVHVHVQLSSLRFSKCYYPISILRCLSTDMHNVLSERVSSILFRLMYIISKSFFPQK